MDDIPILASGDKKKDAELCVELLHELPSICQGVGVLNERMKRCRRTDSKLFIQYDAARTKLENRRVDISSFITMFLTVTHIQ